MNELSKPPVCPHCGAEQLPPTVYGTGGYTICGSCGEPRDDRRHGMLVEVYGTSTPGKTSIRIVDAGPESLPLGDVAMYLGMAQEIVGMHDQKQRLEQFNLMKKDT